jgi:hypothetical protein
MIFPVALLNCILFDRSSSTIIGIEIIINGFNLNASIKWRCSNACTALKLPQPGHLYPVKDKKGHLGNHLNSCGDQRKRKMRATMQNKMLTTVTPNDIIE